MVRSVDHPVDRSFTRPSGRPPTALIVAAFAALYILWGSTYAAMHILMHNGFTPFFTAGMRMTTAGSLMCAWLVSRGHAAIGRRDIVALVGSAALLMIGGNALTMVASKLVPSGLIALLGATTPFWLAVGGFLLDGEQLSPIGIAGVVAGFSGVYILSSNLEGTASGWGIAASLFASFFWALGGLWGRRLPHLRATVVSAYQMLFGGLMLLVVGTLRGEPAQLAPTIAGWEAFAYLVVCGSLLGFNAFVFLLANVPAAKVATYAYVNPVIAVGLGWVLLGETITPRVAVGAAVILGGVVLVNAAKVKRS